MARYMRTDLGRGHSNLRPPVVVTPDSVPGSGKRDLRITLVAVERSARKHAARKTVYKLRRPVVVTPAAVETYYGPKVTLVDSHKGVTHSALRPPSVIGAGKVNPGLRVKLVSPDFFADRVRRRGTTTFLRPPAILASNLPTRVELAPSRRQIGRARLSPPAVVTPAVSEPFRGIQLHLAPSRRPKTRSTYIYPIVVSQARAWGYVAIQYVRRYTPPTHSKLFPPAVTTAVAQVYYGPSVTLAPSRRPKTSYALAPPAVIGAGKVNPGLRIKLVFGPRSVAKSKLQPPAVVTAVVTEAFYGPQTSLAYSRRPRPKSALRPPTDTVGLEDQGRISVHLVRVKPPTTLAFLKPPTVITPAVAAVYGIQTTLVRIKPAIVRSSLTPPTVVFEEAQFFGPLALLTYQVRPRAKSRLRPAVVVTPSEAFYGPKIHLTRIKPPLALSILRVPTDTVGLEDQGRVSIHLARIKPRPTTTFLSPPAVVFGAVEIYGPEVHVTRIKPPPTLALLKPPTDVSDQQDIGVLRAHLTYSLRGRPTYFLTPPAVVGEIVYSGPSVELAPSSRGTPKSRLFSPTAVEQPPAFLPGEIVWLTPSRRPVTKYALRPPVVVGAGKVNPRLRRYLVARQRRLLERRVQYFLGRPQFFEVEEVFYGPAVTLAASRRGKPLFFLSPPSILKTGGTLQITLAPQRRGRPVYRLRPAVVVRLAVEIYGPAVELAYSRRGRPQYRLSPPAVVGRAPFRPIAVHLTRIKPPETRYLLKPPSVVRAADYFLGPIVHLTRITPPKAYPFLKLPSVVGAGVAFYGPQITLVRIRPPRVMHLLRVTFVAHRRPHGDVCGFDIATTFVCHLEAPGAQVSGTDAAVGGVQGASQARSKVTGSESAGGSVSGSDRKAT